VHQVRAEGRAGMRGCLVTTEDSERRTQNEGLRTKNLELALPLQPLGSPRLTRGLLRRDLEASPSCFSYSASSSSV
jgi:hypothetical protein